MDRHTGRGERLRVTFYDVQCRKLNEIYSHYLQLFFAFVLGAVRAGDINGFKGDLLQGLSFRNVSFQTPPKHGWSCGYVDAATFIAEDVVPKLTCSQGPSSVERK